MKQDQINFIRQKCVEANASIQDREYCCKYATYDRRNFCDRCSKKPLELHLADVLLAELHASTDRVLCADAYGDLFLVGDDNHPAKWNLRDDDLREQSDETVQFIYDLLR